MLITSRGYGQAPTLTLTGPEDDENLTVSDDGLTYLYDFGIRRANTGISVVVMLSGANLDGSLIRQSLSATLPSGAIGSVRGVEMIGASFAYSGGTLSPVMRTVSFNPVKTETLDELGRVGSTFIFEGGGAKIRFQLIGTVVGDGGSLVLYHIDGRLARFLGGKGTTEAPLGYQFPTLTVGQALRDNVLTFRLVGVGLLGDPIIISMPQAISGTMGEEQFSLDLVAGSSFTYTGNSIEADFTITCTPEAVTSSVPIGVAFSLSGGGAEAAIQARATITRSHLDLTRGGLAFGRSGTIDDPYVYDFGTVVEGTPPTLGIRLVGEFLTAEEVTLQKTNIASGIGHEDFTLSPPGPYTSQQLPVDITITFAPMTAGARGAVLTFAHPVIDSDVVLELRGELLVGPSLLLDDAGRGRLTGDPREGYQLRFAGTTPTNGRAVAELNITAQGLNGTPLTLTGATRGGSGSTGSEADFADLTSVAPLFYTGTSLSKSFPIIFYPSEAGTRSGIFQLSGGGITPLTITVTGTGIQPTTTAPRLFLTTKNNASLERIAYATRFYSLHAEANLDLVAPLPNAFGYDFGYVAHQGTPNNTFSFRIAGANLGRGTVLVSAFGSDTFTLQADLPSAINLLTPAEGVVDQEYTITFSLPTLPTDREDYRTLFIFRSSVATFILGVEATPMWQTFGAVVVTPLRAVTGTFSGQGLARTPYVFSFDELVDANDLGNNTATFRAQAQSRDEALTPITTLIISPPGPSERGVQGSESDFSLIQEANSLLLTFTPSATGDRAAVFTLSNAGNETAHFLVQGSGQNETLPILSTPPPEQKSALLFPNPTQGVLFVGEEVRSITLLDLAGNVVLRQILNRADRRVDLSRLPTGWYLARLHTPSGVITQRIIRQ